MKKFILLFCTICFSVQGVEQEDIRTLLNRVRPDETVRSQVESTLGLGGTLSPQNEEQLNSHLQRMLQYALDFPLLMEGAFMQKQSHLIWLAARTLKQNEVIPLDDDTANHHQVHFIYDEETGEKFAVFKSGGQRNYERMTWELAYLFGLEDVFTPALSLNLSGYSGVLQPFQKTDLTTEQTNDRSLYDLIAYESYMKCSLGVLLFALQDMHSENSYYQFCREGYIKMGFWDTEAAFEQDQFLPYFPDSGSPSLDTPFSWIGFDSFHYERVISKRFRPILMKIVGSWPKRIQMFRDYLSHPLTLNSLSDEDMETLIQRAQSLHQTILRHPEQPISEWHKTLCPKYVEAEEKLKEFFPDEDTMWILFQLKLNPDEAYGLIDGGREEEFKSWLEAFLMRT